MNIMERIKTSDEWTIGGLLALYRCQTADERQDGYTKWQNNMGFNALDAEVMSDISEFYLRKKYLTVRQVEFVRRTILKYHGQLEQMAEDIMPAVIRRPEDNKAPVKIIKKAIANDDPAKITLTWIFPKGDKRFYDTLKFVKGFRFAFFDPNTKNWTIPFSLDNMARLLDDTQNDTSDDTPRRDDTQTIPWEIDDTLTKRFDALNRTIIPDETLKIAGLKGTLRPFQCTGISFIDKTGGKALIGDEMGLGKTIQALGWLQLHKEVRPALVVCPASVKYNWAREAKAWMDNDTRVVVLNGRPNGNETPDADIYITNYDILSNTTQRKEPVGNRMYNPVKAEREEVRGTGWGDVIMKRGVKAAIFDECHYVKNNKALRTEAFKRICDKVDYVIGLSGTPVENRPKEFYNILYAINSDLFRNWADFAVKYCGGHRGTWGWEFDNEKADGKALHELITKNIMIRRLKSEVLPDLPPKCRNVVSIPMEDSFTPDYEAIMQKILTFDRSTKPQIVLTEIERAKQIAVAGKLKAASEWVENFLDTGKKLVLFCEHKNVADWFENQFKDCCVRLTGNVNAKDREKAIDNFQNNDAARLFIGSQAAKEGITLTAASDTVFIELWWKPGSHDQAEDRVHRIGQEAESINAWYLLASGTIEEDLAALLDEKRKIIAETLDGREPEDIEMLTELWKRLKKEEV